MHPCFQLLKDNGFDLERDLFIPITFSHDMKLSADKWGIRLAKTIMKGKRKYNESAILTLTFCPMCGERLVSTPPDSAG